jgi:hypothetical protein
MIRMMAAFAATVLLPFAATAAELPVRSAPHRLVGHRLHHVHIYVPRQHFGYYFGRWGWRSGGTASSWYGSTFALAGGPWDRPSIELAASPKGVAAIHCPALRPDGCLAEPVIAAVSVAEPLVGR